ncbi:hypothetical protein B0H15DRAFT_953653 [Mycena belliarum]|uniref:Uncharacterized protein n=1 Tax=Mycena belliarum TaxID=1033014 RepID=A0AAD6TXV1_9AGAR|nr:hypothetical protein B0H15DRAFT_953653 [Mycena belliae]
MAVPPAPTREPSPLAPTPPQRPSGPTHRVSAPSRRGAHSAHRARLQVLLTPALSRGAQAAAHHALVRKSGTVVRPIRSHSPTPTPSLRARRQSPSNARSAREIQAALKRLSARRASGQAQTVWAWMCLGVEMHARTAPDVRRPSRCLPLPVAPERIAAAPNSRAPTSMLNPHANTEPVRTSPPSVVRRPPPVKRHRLLPVRLSSARRTHPPPAPCAAAAFKPRAPPSWSRAG